MLSNTNLRKIHFPFNNKYYLCAMNLLTLLFLESLGGGELMVIMLFVLMFFGSAKIPELAKGLGKGMREFKDAMNGVQNEIKAGMNNIESEVNKVKDDVAREVPQMPIIESHPMAQSKSAAVTASEIEMAAKEKSDALLKDPNATFSAETNGTSES